MQAPTWSRPLSYPAPGLPGSPARRDIENSRMPSAVGPVLARCGLISAIRGDYAAWMQQRRRAAIPGKAGDFHAHCGGRRKASRRGGMLPGPESRLARPTGRPPAGCPCAGLCDEFVVKPVEAVDGLEQAFDGIDLILPALEDPEALDALGRFSAAAGLAFAFDPLAHRVSSSKLMSDRFFAELQIPLRSPGPMPASRSWQNRAAAVAAEGSASSAAPTSCAPRFRAEGPLRSGSPRSTCPAPRTPWRSLPPGGARCFR